MRNNGGHGIIKEIVEVIITNNGKKIKQRYGLKNKLIIFTSYSKLFFTLIYIIKLFYQIYLIYLMT